MILTLFFWAMMILLVATLIFYAVFFGLIYYWHVTKITILIVPLIFTFEFFLIGFLVVSLAVIILNYAPMITEMFIK